MNLKANDFILCLSFFPFFFINLFLFKLNKFHAQIRAIWSQANEASINKKNEKIILLKFESRLQAIVYFFFHSNDDVYFSIA